MDQAEELERENSRLQIERNHIEVLYKEKSDECNGLLKELSEVTSVD